MQRILIVDDELSVRESLRMLLKGSYETLAASSGEECLRLAESEAPDLVLLDIIMPGLDGMKILQRLRKHFPNLPVIMITATKTVKTAVDAMKLGAYDYLTKPFEMDELKMVIEKSLNARKLEEEVISLRREVHRRYGFDNIIGKSKALQVVFRTIEQIAVSRTTALIRGESGTGKELVARAIHHNSPRRDHPFVAINCAAIPESLIESELFGHERGAFTDARTRRLGRFEQAHAGTLFLDEIGELSLATQAKILRVLQEKEFQRLGGTETIRVDVRLIAATNKDIEEAVRNGTFRSDLYYRINVVPIFVPPLRERSEDIPLLVESILSNMVEGKGNPPMRVSKEALDLLARYAWPGNVRELENVLERALTLTSGAEIGLEDLSNEIRAATRVETLKGDVLSGRIDFEKAERRFERELILAALQRSDFVQTQAAELLGITRRMLKYKMDKLGIPSKEA